MAAKEPVAKGSRATSALTKASFLGEPGKQLVKFGTPVHKLDGKVFCTSRQVRHCTCVSMCQLCKDREIFSCKASVLRYLIS